MTKLLYLEDSYLKRATAKVKRVIQKGNSWQMILDRTIYYSLTGDRASDTGKIIGAKGKFLVENVRLDQSEAIHFGKLEGEIKNGEKVNLYLDWERRFRYMQLHSASYVICNVVMKLIPGIIPIKTQEGERGWIKYQGKINPKLAQTIETQSNMLIAEGRKIICKFVTLTELKMQTFLVPPHLVKDKPLHVAQIDGFWPLPNNGPHVKNTLEIGNISQVEIETNEDESTVFYQVAKLQSAYPKSISQPSINTQVDLTLNNFQTLLLELEKEILTKIDQAKAQEAEILRLKYFGRSGQATKLIRLIKSLPPSDRKKAGLLVNAFKNTLKDAFEKKSMTYSPHQAEWLDTTLPGIRPPQGHLHIVTQAIAEITRIFERLGFYRVRYPEVDWDWYAFESLNMPKNHPARDEWETFFINSPKMSIHHSSGGAKQLHKSGDLFNQIVLTPHTSNSQIREMEKGKLPIRMINIAKCYRRQSDVSHTPMFHQFEGMYIDKNVSISHLKAVLDFFVKQFYGPQRQIRLRPFHFQFTEPSFEVDITCDLCGGTGKIFGNRCRLCKAGWLEMAGAGMIHPVVLRNGGIDPHLYSGFAFGWGVERAYMMKTGLKIDDLRIIYGNDLRFLKQF